MARPYTEKESSSLKKEFLELLRVNTPVDVACKKLGIVRSTVYYWRGSDSKFQEDFDAADHESISSAETSLYRLIADDNLGAICFYLKTRGKKFGYIMSSEVHEKHEQIESKPTATDAEIIARYRKGKKPDAK
jgi:hypothetical protein